MRAGRLALLTAACAAFFAFVLTTVDLAPRVEADFFFASDDPQLAASTRVEELFPGSPQILVRAAGDVQDSTYLERLKLLTETLAEVPGVTSVYSLTKGPSSPSKAADSPLWRRLLLPAGDEASLLLLEVEENEGGGASPVVAAVEDVLTAMEEPGFTLDASGVPYVVELIRRHLLRDLKVFSLASLLLFGLAVAVIYRSVPVVLGSLLCCLTACAATLLALHLSGLAIGLLTANIATIVFVLTLSHVIFLTAAWKASGAERPEREAVARTVPASTWCMVTTLAGFSSLLFASARPLRELGIAGALGSLAAMAAAYGLYPLFLAAGGRQEGGGARAGRAPWAERPWKGAVAAVCLLVLAAAPGLWLLDTDPSLLAYFDDDGELYQGLAAIDRGGGSSPLDLVVVSPDGETLEEGPPFEKLQQAQAALEEDPAVGSALSLPVLLAEARRAPLASFLATSQLLALLDSPAFGELAGTFITKDRKTSRIFLRMREEGRQADRSAVVDRLVGAVEATGLEVSLVGGLYDLQGRLSRLVTRSIFTGLAGLLVLFAVVGFIVSRRLPTTAVMLAGVAAVPVLIFGLFGYLALPLDVISAPAANVAVAVGIDSMIHLVLARRRLRGEGVAPAEAWVEAKARMAAPIASAAVIVAAGFGIFALSSFPPTRHFGLAVVVGTLAAAALALLVLPFFAGRSLGRLPRATPTT